MDLSRRSFCGRLVGTGLCVVSGASSLAGNGVEATRFENSVLRIVPAPDTVYPPGFLRFIDGKRFQNVRQAVMAVRNQDLPYKIEVCQ